MVSAPVDETLATTGIAGLDDILDGGLARDRLYLVEGTPGSGKSTLALQFLLAGAAAGERCMLVTLSEREHEIRASAASHGWTLDGVDIVEISPQEPRGETGYRMFHPSEVEFAETTQLITNEIDRRRPTRLVLDSLAELRLLAEDALRYRRQILSLKQDFARRRCTVLFVEDQTGEQRDMLLHSIAHGVLCLEGDVPAYGAMRRRLRVQKMRGRAFREGYHDYLIRRGGVVVFPRLIAGEHRAEHAPETVASGIPQLDALLGDGLARGTSTLILGATGVGKSSLAAQYARTAGERGDRVCMFLFEESVATCLRRAAVLGIELAPLVEAGLVTLRQIDPAELTPGEFAHDVRRAVETEQARMIVIDSLTGYHNAMPSERYLTLHMHQLLTYLAHHNVTTLLLLTQHGLLDTQTTAIDASYLADTVILMRYFEAGGELRQSVAALKKRTGPHERTIRELRLGPGLSLGEPLREYRGVLTGVSRVGGA